MATYDEFRLHLTPDEAAPGAWKVQLVACPINAMVGGKGSVTPVLTKEQLRRIRSPHDWPSLGELRAIGESVWSSIMNNQVEAAFQTCVLFSKQQGRRLRLVLAIEGEDQPQPGDRAGLAEL